MERTMHGHDSQSFSSTSVLGKLKQNPRLGIEAGDFSKGKNELMQRAFEPLIASLEFQTKAKHGGSMPDAMNLTLNFRESLLVIHRS